MPVQYFDDQGKHPVSGFVPLNVFMTSIDTPASLGVHGPGEITICFGDIASISATEILSFR